MSKHNISSKTTYYNCSLCRVLWLCIHYTYSRYCCNSRGGKKKNLKCWAQPQKRISPRDGPVFFFFVPGIYFFNTVSNISSLHLGTLNNWVNLHYIYTYFFFLLARSLNRYTYMYLYAPFAV